MSSSAPQEGASGSAPRSARSRSTGGKPRPKLARPTGPPPSCPRCQADSEHTKFCYYNNYNVNQPRYYCKACQRHWTAGGTLRKVESGAGKRNNRRQRSLGPGGKGRSAADGIDATSTISPAAASDQDPASYMLQAGDSGKNGAAAAGAAGWSSAAGRAPEAFMAASAATPLPAFEHGNLPWPKGFASAELTDDMLVASDPTNMLKGDASQALLDMDTVLTDEALDAMFAAPAGSASASAPAQLAGAGAWASQSGPANMLATGSDSQVQLARGRAALGRNWSDMSHTANRAGAAASAAAAASGLPPTSAALRTHMTSGPPPMVASSYPSAPQVFEAHPNGAPGMGVQQPPARAPTWAHSAGSEQRPGSLKRDNRGEAKSAGGGSGGENAVGGEVGGQAPMLPHGWLPLDHPGAEAQRLRAAHAARDAALQMQRQAATMYPPMPPFMAMALPHAHSHAHAAARPQLAPGSYSCPPQGAVNVARPQFAAPAALSNAPNWQHVGINSSSVSTQSMAQQEGFNAAFDFAMAAAAHPASPPPAQKAASDSAPGSFVARHDAAASGGGGMPPQQ